MELMQNTDIVYVIFMNSGAIDSIKHSRVCWQWYNIYMNMYRQYLAEVINMINVPQTIPTFPSYARINLCKNMIYMTYLYLYGGRRYIRIKKYVQRPQVMISISYPADSYVTFSELQCDSWSDLTKLKRFYRITINDIILKWGMNLRTAAIYCKRCNHKVTIEAYGTRVILALIENILSIDVHIDASIVRKCKAIIRKSGDHATVCAKAMRPYEEIVL
jgi:hypothetical protein